MILPLKKFQLPEEVTSQAIPMLSDRQFVVEKTKLSPEEDKLQRELFWYREELFESVCGHWREVRLTSLIQSFVADNPEKVGWDSIR
jgi:trafficking protein particle complex subunit 9